MQKELILQRLTMEQVLRRYTTVKIMHGRCDCPLHGGDKCFVVYENSFYCFSCGKGGDLIKFVSLFFNMDYKTAMIRLDSDFCLGLFCKPSLKDKHKWRAECEKIKAQQQEKLAVKHLSYKCYSALCDYFLELKELYPDADVIEQCIIVNTLLDFLFKNEDFVFDYENLIHKMRKQIGGVQPNA